MEGKEQFFPNFAPYPVPQSHTVTADIQHPSIEQLKKELWGHCDSRIFQIIQSVLKATPFRLDPCHRRISNRIVSSAKLPEKLNLHLRRRRFDFQIKLSSLLGPTSRFFALIPKDQAIHPGEFLRYIPSDKACQDHTDL